MRNIKQLISTASVFLITFSIVSGSTVKDTVHIGTDNIMYFPPGNFFGGKIDGSTSMVAQFGVGVRLPLNTGLHLSSIVNASVFFNDTSATPSFWFTIRGEYNWNIFKVFEIGFIGSLNFGGIYSDFRTSFQTLAGTQVKYLLRSIVSKSNNDTFEFKLFLCAGYGVDHLLDNKRGFVNVGLMMDDWIEFSFDVYSLVKPFDPVINLGRLR